MKKRNSPPNFPRWEIRNRLHTLNQAKRALDREQSEQNQRRYDAAYGYFEVFGFEVELIKNRFALKQASTGDDNSSSL